MNIDIKHNQNDSRGIFFYKKEEKTMAELTYSHEDNVMTIDHTEVNPDLEGNGIGTHLVHKAVEYAQKNNMKVHPLCPFAEVLFDENDQWSDLRV
ncbi:GNAT family N-acetyltransferase [Nonlabens sp. SY33080]|uniref:GNAT family N-acetyltransferase n=1 Tax=Nonlabens sp. SY33080 TaxID=2719911 RepID=UPI001F0F5697|nr:GNAT family N-acetyltransferase [Nonlabens sp. SY33080]